MAASKKDNVNAGRVEYLGDDREGKLAALNNAVAAIEKNYGKGSIMKLGDSGANIDIEAIPTGSISLDVALGVGGVPRGRIIEIYGPESSGKTTVALHMIAEAQKRNGIAGFIDAEHALDPQYAKKIGVDIDNLYISQPDNGEQALEIAETMIRSGALDIVIVDSVAALVPKAEIEGDMDDQQVGLHARLMSKAMRKLTGVINRSNCAVVFINQLREKVGIMFGNPEVTTGGRALKFYSSVRLDVRKSNMDCDNEVSIRDLIRSSLRMRPDRIIVGETRGEEALDMLQAMGTGHDGSLSTGHSNSSKDMLTRLRTMVLMGIDMPAEAIDRQIASAIDIIVHLKRMRDKTRKVWEITEVCGYKNNEFELVPLYKYVEEGEDKNGNIIGTLKRQNNSLKNTEKLEWSKDTGTMQCKS